MTQQKDHNNNEHENLAWLDIETTGLCPHEDAILEVGIVITTKDLELVARKAVVTTPSKNVGLWSMDNYVYNMHLKSGLWADCFSDGAVCLKDAVDELRQFMLDNNAVGSPMCGNTINFDRSFAKAQMHKLNELFHYRNIDVSTLKNVFKMHFPEVAPFEKGDTPHRVLGDLELSIAEYRYYLGHMNVQVG